MAGFNAPAFWIGFYGGSGPSTPPYKVLEDAVVGVTGQPDYASGLAFHFGKLADEHINDAEYRWLVSQGATPRQLSDMWYEVFGPGDITSIKLAYWNSIRP